MKICSDLIRNDVPAKGQLADGELVSFCVCDNADLKILFAGNSITRHGVAENLGWLGDWGMAASARENDYVHLIVNSLELAGKKVSYCVANFGEWERSWNDSLLAEKYSAVRDFGADIVVVRLDENAQLLNRADEFMPHYENLIRFFAGDRARVVLTDLFWQYEPFDKAVERLAKDKGYGFASLSDLGDRDEMKAHGKFEHAGVAAHPGDKGMAEIASRIYKQIEKIIWKPKT